MLLLRDGRAAGGVLKVGVGDRLALDPDFFALDGHGDRLLLGGHVLAETGLAALGLGADPKLLLGAGHGVVGGRPRGVPANSVAVVGRASGRPLSERCSL